MEGWRPKQRHYHGALSLGSAVHLGIQRYNEGVDDPIGHLSELYTLAYEAAPPEEHDSIAKDQRMATVMVRGYIEWAESTGLDSELRDLEPEVFLTASINGGIIAGTLDLRAQDRRGTTLIRDYKTSTNLEAPFNVEQALHYALLDTLNTERKNYVVEYLMMKKVLQTKAARPPFYHVIPVYIHAKEVEGYSQRMLQTIVDMHIALKSGRLYPSPHDMLCKRCDYRLVCPMFDNDGNAQEYLEEYYEQSGDSYSRGFWGGQEPPGRDVAIAPPRRRR